MQEIYKIKKCKNHENEDNKNEDLKPILYNLIQKNLCQRRSHTNSNGIIL